MGFSVIFINNICAHTYARVCVTSYMFSPSPVSLLRTPFPLPYYPLFSAFVPHSFCYLLFSQHLPLRPHYSSLLLHWGVLAFTYRVADGLVTHTSRVASAPLLTPSLFPVPHCPPFIRVKKALFSLQSRASFWFLVEVYIWRICWKYLFILQYVSQIE